MIRALITGFHVKVRSNSLTCNAYNVGSERRTQINKILKGKEEFTTHYTTFDRNPI